MSNLRILFAAASAIVLFLYGLEAFSREIQAVGGEALKKWLGRLTEKRWLGLMLGVAVATAIVQSSSAVTALTVAIVDAGSMSFRSSLAFCLERISGRPRPHGSCREFSSTAWKPWMRATGVGRSQ